MLRLDLYLRVACLLVPCLGCIAFCCWIPCVPGNPWCPGLVLRNSVFTVMTFEIPSVAVSADEQLDALIAEHRLREQGSGTLDGNTHGAASAASLAPPCTVPRAV